MAAGIALWRRTAVTAAAASVAAVGYIAGQQRHDRGGGGGEVGIREEEEETAVAAAGRWTAMQGLGLGPLLGQQAGGLGFGSGAGGLRDVGLLDAVYGGAAWLVRSLRTAQACAEIGVQYRLGLWGLAPDEPAYAAALAQLHEAAADRLLRLCERNGGLYIKAAQYSSSLSSIPKAFSLQLAKLQDTAPAARADHVRDIICKELAIEDVSQAFDDFDPVPVAAASIAQVHRAKLREDGTTVAIKVQHPNLRQVFAGDMLTVKVAASIMGYVLGVDLRWILPEMESALMKELNFEQEGRNAERAASNFQKSGLNVLVPKIFWEKSSTAVLTMEWMDGCKVSDTEAIVAAGYDPRAIGISVMEAYATMVFEHGFVHMDMHPGNVFVGIHSDKQGSSGSSSSSSSSNNGSGGCPATAAASSNPPLILLDHGSYKELSEDFRVDYCTFVKAMISGNEAAMRAASVSLAGGSEELAQFLPLIFASGSANSYEPKKIKELRKAARKLSMQELASAMERLPRDLLMCIRASSLARKAAINLGAEPLSRIAAQARAATAGLYAHRRCLLDRVALTSELAALQIRIKIYRFAAFLLTRRKKPRLS